MTNNRRFINNALLLTVALVLSWLEAQFPMIIPVPGIKLGLANIVTLFALYASTKTDAFLILLLRIALLGVFSAQPVTFVYSLSGGLLSFAALVITRKHTDDSQIWICSIMSAMFHNIGQITAACLILKTASILIYLPVLLLSGILSGLLTGLTAQEAIKRIRPLNNTDH